MIQRVRRRAAADVPPAERDRGAALILAMIIVILGALVIIPLLTYAQVVTQSGKVQTTKAARAEATKAALRVALADPKALYDHCSDHSGLHTEAQLPTANLAVAVTSNCTTVRSATELSASELRVPMTVVQSGATVPVGTVGTPYAGSGSASLSNWIDDTSSTSAGDKIMLPELPSHSLTHPSSAGYAMPAWVGDCRVFFPGSYSDPVTISGTTPVYFTSGIYYFEKTVTFTGSANVVMGGGAYEGCTTDQDAAYNAINAPVQHNITGYGVTLVLGATGRIVVDNSVAGSGPHVYVNSRLVADTDVGSLSSRGVSIVSVNGVLGSDGKSSNDLDVSNVIKVPKSYASGVPLDDAASVGYKPSTLVPVAAPATPPSPIIEVNLTSSSPATFWVPGYVSVPQGRISISVADGQQADKTVQLLGGVLAASFTQSATQPATLQLGIVNRVVQKTFKIVSTTTATKPRVVSTALVQINDYGEYVINAWEITTID